MAKYPELLNTITAFLSKADEDLEEKLKNEEYIKPKDTVNAINEVENELSETLEKEITEIVAGLDGESDIEIILDEILPTLLANDLTDEEITGIFATFLNDFMKESTEAYMQLFDEEIAFDLFSDRTTSWIDEWSEDLGKLMKLTSHDKIQSVLSSSLENGESINKVVDKLVDAYEFSPMRARRTAITEVLTAHSYAKEEAIRQSPVVDRKEWKHSGGFKTKPRENHIAMDGQIVDKDKPFELLGANGLTYYPRFPRDISLPASERVNCHCIHRGVTNDDVFGLSLEKRRQLQAEFIESDNKEWEKEIKAKNKSKAGINKETINYDWIRAKSKEDQIKYFGGVKGKWALLESGVIADDKALETMLKTVSTTRNGEVITKKTFKTLKELADDAIITVSHSTYIHSTLGEFKSSSKAYPNGRLYSGGHSKTSKDKCDDKGIEHEVTKTFSNGVTVGNVPTAKLKSKRELSGQAWFPDTWSDDDIMVAGTFVGNSNAIVNEYHKTDVWNDVAVRILFDEDGKITTICPDLDQDLYVEGVELE